MRKLRALIPARYLLSKSEFQVEIVKFYGWETPKHARHFFPSIHFALSAIDPCRIKPPAI